MFFLAINDHTIQEKLQKDHPTHSKQIGVVNNANDICQEAYSLNVDHQQHPYRKEYVKQSIR